MGFTKIEKLLDRSVKKAGIQQQVQEAKVLEDFSNVMEVMFEPKVFAKVKPLYLKNGVLSVTCLSSVLAEKLKAQEPYILKNLNSFYHKRVVSSLRFLA
ncbi:MAG: DUF721 domain-containing protein [Candidatus Buchananbacteria bacterium]|nr:DUF721 domain-containing protein [Candidatus Buchananbacteria bacterium]